MKFLQKIKNFILECDYKFTYFEVHLTEHCNLNCQSCFHFSPLAQEEYADLLSFENDFKRLAQITKGKIKSLSLMGGEPLLHPKCTEFFKIARKYFPNSNILLVTNGILLFETDELFWENMQKYNIILSPTIYPINLDWNKITQIAEKYNINIHYFNNIKYSQKIPIQLDGTLNPSINYKNCVCKTCYILKNGKIFPCSVAANIHHFIKYFNLNIENSPKNGIDIYKAKTLKQIDNFLTKKIPLCKYCDGSHLENYKKWAVSKKDIAEWLKIS